MAYVDSPPTAVPPEASYEEDWEVFDPWVKHCSHKMLRLIARPNWTEFVTKPECQRVESKAQRGGLKQHVGQKLGFFLQMGALFVAR